MKTEEMKEAIRNGKIAMKFGGFTITTEPSDKEGINWKVYSLNNIVIAKEYIED